MTWIFLSPAAWSVELGLLLLGRGAGAVAGSARDRSSRDRGRRDSETLLERLHQLGELENRHVLDSLDQLFLIYRHLKSY